MHYSTLYSFFVNALSYQCNYIVYQLKKIFVGYFDSLHSYLWLPMKTLVTLVCLRNLNVVPHPKKLSPSSCCQQSQSDSTWLPTHLDDAEIFIDVIHVWNTVCFFCYLQSLLMERDLLLKNIYVITPSGVSLRVMIPRSTVGFLGIITRKKSWSEIVCLLRGGWKWAWSHFRRGLGICPYED